MNIPIFHKTHSAMHSRLDVVIWNYSDQVTQSAFEKIKECVDSIEMTLSRFHYSAETFLLHQIQQWNGAPITERLCCFIEQCQELYGKTNGFFDICYLSPNSSVTDLKLDKALRTISAPKATTLDFGAIGKGIAIDMIAQIIDEFHIEHCFISFGGSSILTRGRHPHGDFWPLMLEEHYNISDTIPLNNHCVSISGMQQGMAHIVDPKTKTLLDGHTTVCVVSQSATEAEALSTALSVAPKDQHESILANFTIDQIFME